MSLAKVLPLISIIDSTSLWDWERIQVHSWVIASRGTWCLFFAAGFACYSWWLPPPRRLGAAMIIERRAVIVSGSDLGDYEGFLTFPRWSTKRYSSGLFVAYVILILYWLCGTYWGFGVWCQLTREPPSEWIATTRSNLPASKWTSMKNHCVTSCHRDCIVIDWLHLVIGTPLYTAV